MANRQQSRIIYKLPPQFLQRHGAMLDAWNWQVRPEMPLSETISDVPALAGVVLEYALSTARGVRGQTAVVRACTGRMALTVRKYAEGVENG